MTTGVEQQPLIGAFRWNAPGKPLSLYRGLVAINGDPASCDIKLDTSNGLSVRWELKNINQHLDDEIDIVLRRGPWRGNTIRALVLGSDGYGVIARPQSMGTGQPMVRVVSHWFNLPVLLMLGLLAEDNRRWRGRWFCVAGEWSITLDSRFDLINVEAETANTTRSAMTHVCDLHRTDGNAFEQVEAAHVLAGLQLAFSFALGRWIAPALPIGYNDDGAPVWTQWGPWRCDPMHGSESWLDTHRADDLAAFVALFLDAWLDPSRHDIVKYYAHHVIAANHSGTTTEGRIMLAQAGMEYLSWVTNVLSGRMSKTAYERTFAQAHEVVRGLIGEARIPSGIPKELDTLASFATQTNADGPRVVSQVRNKLVHPKNPAAVYEIDNLVVESWQLFMHYSDLLLLNWLGYTGSYIWRLPGGFAHASTVVPWSQKPSP
ncbi:MAG: hypothetical protein K8R99_05935 [Actinomycetia bacterium]|nr:hypothetical protein [Actinomycetes bacterium]